MNERVFDFLKVILLVEAGVSACSLVSACISAGYSASRYGAFTLYSFFVIFPSLWNVCVAACTIWLNVALARRINAVKHALEGDAPLCDLPLYPGVLLCVLSATSLLSLPSAVAYAVFTVLYFLFRKKMRVFS